MLKTRINPLASNDSFVIKDAEGNELAYIQAVGDKSQTLNIETAAGLYIEKPSGWRSDT